MSVDIPAKYIPGQGQASKALKLQLPLIQDEFPEVKNCHDGTINVELSVPLFVITPDHRTQPIQWHGRPPGEVFDFLRIKFEALPDIASIDAWLYISHWSGLRRTPYIHEIIAPALKISMGVPCKITINRHVIQLPFSQFPAVVVI